MRNPNWWRTIFASIVLAFLLRRGFHIPFFTTFVAFGIIYTMQIVMTEMREGVEAAKETALFFLRIVGAMVIFLFLRFIFAGLLGLYPVDSLGTMDGMGGIKGVLVGRNTPTSVAFELLFALAAGGMSVAYVRGKGRGAIHAIFAVALLSLMIQIATPKWSGTFLSRQEADTTLIKKGVLGTAFGEIKKFLVGEEGLKKESKETAVREVVLHRKPKETYTPVGECWTPCELYVDFPFRIRTDGQRVGIQWPGLGTVIHYPAVGKIESPPEATSGSPKFTSDEGRSVLIQLDRKETIWLAQ